MVCDPQNRSLACQHEGQFVGLFVFLIKKKSIYLFVIYSFIYLFILVYLERERVCVSMSMHTEVTDTWRSEVRE